jgi:uncharacterized protein
MKLWIDLANSPQVLFFRPLLAEFERRGHQLTLTARDFAQTLPLLRKLDRPFQTISGWTTRKSTSDKAWRAGLRVLALVRFAAGRRFDLAVSHGSHMQIAAAKVLGIPSAMITDYEGQPANNLSMRLATRIIVPESLGAGPLRRWKVPPEKVKTYAGLKEDVYLNDFAPDPAFQASLPVPWDSRVVVVVRPPGASLYHHFEHPYFDELMRHLNAQEHVFIVLLPRFPEQVEQIRAVAPAAWVPPAVVDGPQLIYHADLVISGIGTMNREAAVLGTPAYSAFMGEMGAVDQALIREGRLVHIAGQADFAKIILAKHAGKQRPSHTRAQLLQEVASIILDTSRS